MRAIAMALLVVVSPLPASAGDHRTEVFAALMSPVETTARGIVSRSAGQHEIPRIVVASHTAGGASLTVREWLIHHRGRVVGREMAESFDTNNRERHELGNLVPSSLPRVTIEGNTPAAGDWEKIEQAHPGTNMLIAFSQPAFDSLSTVSLVRVDYFPRRGRAETQIHQVERAPSGQWVRSRSAHGAHENMHSERGHLHLPEDADWYHDRE